MSAVAAGSPMQMSAEISENPGAGVWESKHSYSNIFLNCYYFFLCPALTKYMSGLESTVWAQARLVLWLQLRISACVCEHSFLLS